MIICQEPELKEAAEFYASKLNIDDNAIIAVATQHHMSFAGFCEYHDDDIIPYCVIIVEGSPSDEDEDPIETLAHEMVHAKQYLAGQLVDMSGHIMWCGKQYEEFDPSTEEYFFSPWEIEAFGMQVGLYRMYCRSL